MMTHKKKKWNKGVLMGLSVAMIAMGLVFTVAVHSQSSSGRDCFCPYAKSALYGGTGGKEFSDDLTQVRRISRIIVRSGNYIDSIEVTYILGAGNSVTVRHGGTGGTPITIDLKEGEYITQIAGRAGDYINQISFTTNKGTTFGPYGGTGGAPFRLGDLRTGGFFGRSGNYLDALGVFTAIN